MKSGLYDFLVKYQTKSFWSKGNPGWVIYWYKFCLVVMLKLENKISKQESLLAQKIIYKHI